MSQLSPIPRHRPLGRSGRTVSTLGWGMWRLAGSPASAARLAHAALDAGITLFDTADIYGFDGTNGFGDAESLFGEVLRTEAGLRERIILASKGGIMPPRPYDQSGPYLTSAIDASLRRLGVDHIDLYQIHRPDILAHPAEVARTLTDAISAGKIGAVGVSNMTASQIAMLQQALGSTPIVATQPEISPLRINCFENGELDQAIMNEMAVLAWSPLGGGRLANPETNRDHDVCAALDRVAVAAEVSRTAAAYSWLMAHPAGIIPIVGSQRADRIADAADAYHINWTRTDWYAVLVAARGAPLP